MPLHRTVGCPYGTRQVVTNMFAAAHVVLTGEALMIAKKAGIDMSAYFDAVRVSAGNSYVWETEVTSESRSNRSIGWYLRNDSKDTEYTCLPLPHSTGATYSQSVIRSRYQTRVVVGQKMCRFALFCILPHIHINRMHLGTVR